ncbi:hypothetical protein T01_11759 [Trichinella spiralis]|uniref:Uncharacterized protein n=1 Tax=Trichinella spiralis TaxID=6334 RepID=A0A0V1AW29_TRISP|nr:hypothetical protein T01_11759 [Trichinella spiralis]
MTRRPICDDWGLILSLDAAKSIEECDNNTVVAQLQTKLLCYHSEISCPLAHVCPSMAVFYAFTPSCDCVTCQV